MKTKNFLMALAATAAMTAAADQDYLYWMVDTAGNPDVGLFSYATVRESDSEARLAFYDTAGNEKGTEMAVAGYNGDTVTSGTQAGPLYTGLAGDYDGADSFVFELWLEGSGGDSLVGHATYTYSQLGKYVYSSMTAGSGNTPLSVQAIPEPTSALLLLCGLAGLALRRRRGKV